MGFWGGRTACSRAWSLAVVAITARGPAAGVSRALLPTLLLALVLVLPAVQADSPSDPRMRQGPMERWESLNQTQQDRGLERAEAHGLFARFLYDGGNGTAYGRFLRFTLQPNAGSVSDVRKGMDRLVEAGNPEYFAWLSDQGMLPIDVVKQQLRIFGEQVLPHYRS